MENFIGKVFRLKENVSIIFIDDEDVILDTKKRCYYTLNETASFLLRQLENKDGMSSEDIKLKLTSEYDIDEEDASREVSSVFGMLLELDLVDILEKKETAPLNIQIKNKRKGWESPAIKPEGEILTVVGQATVHRAAAAQEMIETKSQRFRTRA